MSWQPIETAPKDGTQVLLYIPPAYRSPGYYVIGWWSDLAWEDSEHIYDEPEPTHWAALTPPEGE